MQTDEMNLNAKKRVATNEFDVQRAGILCRDDIALEQIALASKRIGIVYAIIWAAALVGAVYIIASHWKQ